MAESVRTFWKGHLRLALVNIPIRLVSAEKAEADVSFHQVDRTSKQRIKYIKSVPGKGEVKKEDIVLAYEVEPGNYVYVEDEEFDQLKLKSRQTVELVQFVDAGQIDPLYFERPYYVLPDGEVAEEGYRVIRDALKASGKIGIGQLTLRGKEDLVALFPGGNGLVLNTLRYDSEIKDADEVFGKIGTEKARDDMMQMAEELIERRTEQFRPEKFHNRYNEALRELIESKVKKGEAVPVDEADSAKEPKVIDFMEALKRSVADKAAAATPTPPAGDDKPAGKRSSKTSKGKG